MKFTKRYIISLVVAIVLALFLSLYKLPYYVYKPGDADALSPIVDVENGYDSEGEMHLVTVRGGQATPIQYALANVLPYHELIPINQVIPEGITEDDYFHAQLRMMESSQQASIMVAYQKAKKKIDIKHNGVFVVSVLENVPAEDILKPGDLIIRIDQTEINEADELIRLIEQKKAKDRIELTIVRDNQQLKKEIVLDHISENQEKIGLGIQLVTDRVIEVEPEVYFSSGSIGGPSAGLMFALEIYDQLTKEDLTKGLNIVGTGEIDFEGNVHRIGGIDKKVIAADRKECDVFFAPNENGAKDSNYQIAKKTAEEIGTDMKIIPVDTFDDALNYLKQLKEGW